MRIDRDILLYVSDARIDDMDLLFSNHNQGAIFFDVPWLLFLVWNFGAI